MGEWKYVSLGDICTIERGGSPRPIDAFLTDSSEGINWIKIGDTTDSMYITKTAQKIKPEGAKKSRYVQPGDFLLSNSMSFGRPYILKIDGCIHDGWLVIRDDKNKFDKQFLYYYLSSPVVYSTFKSMAVGGVVNNLNSGMVRKLQVPIPNLEEQKRIAEKLNTINHLIDQRHEQLKTLDTLVKSQFIEMFGNPNPDTKEWCLDALGNHLDVIGGYAFKSTGFKESGIPVLKIGNINSGKFTANNLAFWEDDPQLERYKIYPEDLVMSLTGTVGKDDYGNVCIMGADYPEYYLNQRNAKLIPHTSLDSIYLAEMLKFPQIKKRLTGISRGVRQANISNKDILELPVYIPGIEKQKVFRHIVQQADKSKFAIRQSLEQLETLKKALMQEYFG